MLQNIKRVKALIYYSQGRMSGLSEKTTETVLFLGNFQQSVSYATTNIQRISEPVVQNFELIMLLPAKTFHSVAGYSNEGKDRTDAYAFYTARTKETSRRINPSNCLNFYPYLLR